MGRLKWELINGDFVPSGRFEKPRSRPDLNLTVLRAKVHNGWLIRTADYETNGGLTFVPDPNHSWNP